MNKLRTRDVLALVLVIIGGLNWGLVGLADFNLVSAVFGEGSTVSTVVYALVGVSALFLLFTIGKLGRK